MLTFAALVLVAASLVALDVVRVGEMFVVLGAGEVGAGRPRCGDRKREKEREKIHDNSSKGW